MICTACGTANEPGRKFCGECGARLTVVCQHCGAENAPGVKFCGECGEMLVSVENVGRPAPALPAQQPSAERRLVSVLFADLVGFTALSEHRDTEDVRDLLTRYFETTRRLVERYGGVVEKFIGDAVMAVWGAPIAQEDDAERAVRTALDLVAAVSALGDEFGSTDLRLRAAVMTGEAAVTIGASGQGMVAGDLVNTASRVQAIAAPGEVFVSEATRRATEAAIAYDDAGMHELKGKTDPIHAYRARRVIAARRGEGRSLGLEPPFVGRDREFRLVKELFHASADEPRARLVSIMGLAGIGKSRLSWEFEKYIDGLADDVLWHRGRCLAYGDGVAYWALGEMVRMRARIAEDDEPDEARTKLRQTLEQHIPLAADREFLEPRLAHLIGLTERTALDKEDLFSAWRLFFEQLAAIAPVVMVFEDLQWADAGLLDFIEYLLDWSRAFPLYVVTLSRPDLATRRPSWGAGQRDYTSIFLDPLQDGEIATLLEGLVPGLPDDLRSSIVERAEGVPLYAVETVRMLLDRGMLARDGDRYSVAGPIDALAVPETLHALVAARLDGLEPAERLLLCDAAVLGKSFTREGLAALSQLSADTLDSLVASLVRKEILSVQSDRLSPERGQLTFVQDLLRRVTYETMSRRERKARHLAAAAHIQAEPGGEEELAGIVASHLLDAFRAAEEDPDALELKSAARTMLVRAGERAASLAASAEAATYLERAVGLCDDPRERAGLLDRVGSAMLQAGDSDAAAARFEEAVALLEGIGDSRPAARAAGRLAEALRFGGRMTEALEVLEQAYGTLAGGPRDADLAAVAAEYGRVAFFSGRYDVAVEPIELALDLSEALKLPQVLAEALNTKGVILYRRATESEALIRQAVRVALAHDYPPTALRAQYNLAGLFMEHDRYAEATGLLQEALELSRRRGYRPWETQMLTQLADNLSSMGLWDEAGALVAEVSADMAPQTLSGGSVLLVEARIAKGRGTYGRVSELLEQMASMRDAGDPQDQASFLVADSIFCRFEGRYAEAIESGRRAFDVSRSLYQLHYAAEALVEAIEAAMDADDIATAEQLREEFHTLDAIERRPLLDAQAARIQARLGSDGDEQTDLAFSAAVRGFRAIEARYWLAVTLCEHGEWLAARDRAADAEPLLAESAMLFTDLRALPWLQRIAALDAGTGIPTSS